jgi:predicted enzyme related to lactoylglutathione lyase
LPTVKGPDFIALQVRDLEASRRFYRDAVGLAESPQSPPDAVLFNTSPIPFAVRKPHVDLGLTNPLGHGVALWFYCDDSVALCSSLKSKGVQLLDEPTPGPFGMTFHFKDVDGYVITVHDKA